MTARLCLCFAAPAPLLGSALVCFVTIAACGGAPSARPERPPQPAAETAPGAIQVPPDPPQVLQALRTVASGLNNPRGMLQTAEGLLVTEAGTGSPEDPDSGALLRLRDENGDGDFDDPTERETLMDAQPSKNIVHIVRRDEVFGMAAVQQGGGQILVTQAFFGGPSRIYELKDERLELWSEVHGNINHITYDPTRRVWLGASSTSDEVVKLQPGGGAERVVKVPPLSGGQDSVPGYVHYDPETHDVLVSLFSGSVLGEEGGEGTELVSGAGMIVRVNPDSGAHSPLITGLTAPTDFALGPDGSVFVLELCDGFVDPIEQLPVPEGEVSHGGFRRFSGRLLKVDRDGGQTEVVADGLDTPTNLERTEGGLYIAQGMGTPGRLIPGPEGPVELDGYIQKLSW